MYNLYFYNNVGFCVGKHSSLSFVKLLSLISNTPNFKATIYDRFNDRVFIHEARNNV